MASIAQDSVEGSIYVFSGVLRIRAFCPVGARNRPQGRRWQEEGERGWQLRRRGEVAQISEQRVKIRQCPRRLWGCAGRGYKAQRQLLACRGS